MDAQADRKVVLVTRRTRLEDLLLRFHTLAQAKFYIEHLGADFGDYLKENESYLLARKATVQTLEAHGRYQIIDRAFLPNFLFAPSDVVVTLGQDGLVANTLKYLTDQSETSPSLKIKVFNASKKDLVKDFRTSSDFDQSALFKQIYEEEYGTFGGSPFPKNNNARLRLNLSSPSRAARLVALQSSGITSSIATHYRQSKPVLQKGG